MKKIQPLPFLLILTTILMIMSLPRALSERGRGAIAALFAPLWGQVVGVTDRVSKTVSTESLMAEEVQRLETENASLKRELKHLTSIIQQELYLSRSGVQRTGHWQQLIDAYNEAIPARVIYRNPSSWNSSCWLNVGEAENGKLGRKVIAKNSPVVIGYSLVGVIDFVGTHQSRVRLLTDSGLTPSVRSVRGEPKQRMLAEQLNLMMDNLMDQDRLFATNEEKMQLIEQLEQLEKSLLQDTSALYLAKGVVSGCSQPIWRGQGQLLKGTGFNCDFADSLSPARDLRTGVTSLADKHNPLALIKKNDLLITTGMDGIFPAGLHVAKVAHVEPLKEGDYYYELEAMPIAGNLNELSLLYILPPVGYDPEEQPPLMGWE